MPGSAPRCSMPTSARGAPKHSRKTVSASVPARGGEVIEVRQRYNPDRVLSAYLTQQTRSGCFGCAACESSRASLNYAQANDGRASARGRRWFRDRRTCDEPPPKNDKRRRDQLCARDRLVGAALHRLDRLQDLLRDRRSVRPQTGSAVRSSPCDDVKVVARAPACSAPCTAPAAPASDCISTTAGTSPHRFRRP